jgi:hypothetical protein
MQSGLSATYRYDLLQEILVDSNSHNPKVEGSNPRPATNKLTISVFLVGLSSKSSLPDFI